MKKSMRLKLISLVASIGIIFSACGATDKMTGKNLTAKNIEFRDSKDKINVDRIYETIGLLSNKDNARISGSEGELKTAEYIKKQFQDMGLAVEEQTFPVKSIVVNKEEIVLRTTEEKKLKAEIFALSGSTPPEGINSEVIYLELAKEEDLKTRDLKGKIALIKSGRNFDGEEFKQVRRAMDKGAAAIVFYDPTLKDKISGNKNILIKIPVPIVRISNADAADIIKKLDNKEKVNMSLNLQIETKESTSRNIIGKIKASDKADAKTVVIGGHYDGVDTPAANDNASGIASVLEIARVLSKEKLNVNLEFIAFGSEEIGLVGSKEYVKKLTSNELKNIKAMLNLDMVGVGDTLKIFTNNLTRQSSVAELSMKAIEKFNIKGSRDTSNRSDHAPFEDAGVQVAFYLYDQDRFYHTDEDSIDKINKTNLLNACNVAIAVIKELSDNVNDY